MSSDFLNADHRDLLYPFLAMTFKQKLLGNPSILASIP